MSHANTEANWRWDATKRETRTLWFDQPGRSQNFLTEPVIAELDKRLNDIEGDESARGLIIRSAKPAGFCGGFDLKRVAAFESPAEAETFARRSMAVLDRLAALTIPTLAVIHGTCFGSGLELALACRRRVALASAAPIQMGLPEVHFGLIPGWRSTSMVPRLVGPDEGLNLLLTGRAIGYLLARSVGIVDRLASEGDSIASLDVLSSSPATEREWSKDAWEEAWNRAREQVDEQPGEHPEAQLQILSIIAIELAHGPQAAREASLKAFAELATSELVKEYLNTYLDHGGAELFV